MSEIINEGINLKIEKRAKFLLSLFLPDYTDEAFSRTGLSTALSGMIQVFC